jgi:hypothetical protein
MSEFNVWKNPGSSKRSFLGTYDDLDHAVEFAKNAFEKLVSGESVYVIERHDNPLQCPTDKFHLLKY